MKCEKCNERQANTHIKKIVNGAVTEYYLCDKCANELGELNLSFENDFDDFFGGFFGKTNQLLGKPVSASCSLCGLTLSEFMKSGRLGCPNCYDAFSEYLREPLKRIHGEASHKGKVPKKDEEKITAQSKIKLLKDELNCAVLNEEFEKAAELRDKIKALLKEGEK